MRRDWRASEWSEYLVRSIRTLLDRDNNMTDWSGLRNPRSLRVRMQDKIWTHAGSVKPTVKPELPGKKQDLRQKRTLKNHSMFHLRIVCQCASCVELALLSRTGLQWTLSYSAPSTTYLNPGSADLLITLTYQLPVGCSPLLDGHLA
jgi:hypothetical protein